VTQAFDWNHGVFLGSIMASETTAAAGGQVGKLRFDPMAMLPFCGYNMADYFNHWLSIGTKTDAKKLPQIFFVNWFRRDDNGRFLWPGYGENSRVLKWVFERINGQAKAEKTPIGYLPTHDSLDTNGVNVTNEDLKELLSVDANGWKEAVPQIREHYAAFGERLPNTLKASLDQLESALT
jgi:phosphoenolpyruvate carboxykinase (GTP)